MPVISIPKNILIIGTKLPWIFSEKNTQGFLNCPEEIHKRQETTCPKEVSMDPISITIFWVIFGFYMIVYGIPCVVEMLKCTVGITLILLCISWIIFSVCILIPIMILLLPFIGIKGFTKGMKGITAVGSFLDRMINKIPSEDEETEESDEAMIQKYEMYKVVMDDKIKKIHL